MSAADIRRQARALRRRRLRLGLTQKAVGELCALSNSSVFYAERPSGALKTRARINAALDKYEQQTAQREEQTS